MLWFDNIEIEGFGPYKDRTIVEFPHENGVNIVFGPNMRGKTSLLNAIRYALYGKVLGRGSREIPLSDISNLENKDEGKYGFSVTLNFKYERNQYQLVRNCALRGGLKVPETELDYVQYSFLKKNGDVLGPEQKDVELNTIMPESISRFFLFDGELLQEYEELLIDESEMGNKIRESIEKILGLPVLINARADSRELLSEAKKLEAKAAQNDKETRTIGKHLGDLNIQKDYQEKELEKLTNEYNENKKKKNILESDLNKTQQYEIRLNERNRLKDEEIPELESKKNSLELKLMDLMSDTWRHVIGMKINAKRDEIKEKISVIEKQKTEKSIAEENIKEIREALSEGFCPTCQTSLGEDARENLDKLEKKYSQKYTIDDSEYQKLVQLDVTLSHFDNRSNKEMIKSVNEELDEVSIKIVHYKDKISEIEESLGEHDGSTINYKRYEYEKTIKEVHLLEEGMRKQKSTIDGLEENQNKLTSQLDKIIGVDISKERERRELYEDLMSLFKEGIGMYREKLREKVEKDATDLFVNMTTEPDYVGLKINENYGLTIISKDGTPSPVRSAGAEHIVAFSLIGALQKNTPLRGPVIMDSPFIRLDEKHKKNVLSSLELMAPQVMLLVFESELNPKTARTQLLGKLRTEYNLKRVSGRNTEIIKN